MHIPAECVLKILKRGCSKSKVSSTTFKLKKKMLISYHHETYLWT